MIDITLADIRFTVGRRWIRFAAYYGAAPGSHIGIWRTDAYGMKGLNFRIGRLARCLTAFVHTKALRHGE